MLRDVVLPILRSVVIDQQSAGEAFRPWEAETGVAPQWTVAPTITGTPNDGQTLTVSGGAVTGNPVPTLSYQWMRDGNPIVGATGDTWVATEGTAVTCVITATNAKGEDAVETEAFGPIGAALAAPSWSAAPTITGTPNANQVLSLTGGTVTGNPAPTLTYQWRRDGEDISGATSSTWTATQGTAVVCRITATNSQGTDTIDTEPFGPIGAALAKPFWFLAPTITGTPNAGETLSLTGGNVSGNPEPTFTYQWMRGGSPIAGATSATWVATEGDAVVCLVTAVNSQGSDIIATNPFGPIGAALAAPLWTEAPDIVGVAEEGETLSLDGGTVTGNPEPSLTYQWKRDGDPIEGATSATWTATPGSAVTCTVTATNSQGSDAIDTDPFGPIAADEGEPYALLSLFDSTYAGFAYDIEPGFVFQDDAGTVPAEVGDPVGFVTDRSGNGNHATQTGSERPILRFDGERYYLEADGSQWLNVPHVAETTAHEAAFGVAVTGGAGNLRAIWTQRNRNSGHGLILEANESDQWQVRYGDTFANSWHVNAGAEVVLNEAAVVSFRRSNFTTSMHVGTHSNKSLTIWSYEAAAKAGRLLAGGDADQAAETVTPCRFYSGFAIARELNATQRATVRLYVAGRSGVASLLNKSDARATYWVDPREAFASHTTGGVAQIANPGIELFDVSEPGVARDADYTLLRTDDPIATGHKAFRHRIDPSWDTWSGPTWRSEIIANWSSAPSNVHRGIEYWIGFAYKLEADIAAAGTGEHSLLDFHVVADAGDSNPYSPFHFYIKDGDWRIHSRYNANAVTNAGQSTVQDIWTENSPSSADWHYFAMNVLFHWDAAEDPFIRIWRAVGDAAPTQIVDHESPNCYNDEADFMPQKFGIYRWDAFTGQRTVFTKGFYVFEAGAGVEPLNQNTIIGLLRSI